MHIISSSSSSSSIPREEFQSSLANSAKFDQSTNQPERYRSYFFTLSLSPSLSLLQASCFTFLYSHRQVKWHKDVVTVCMVVALACAYAGYTLYCWCDHAECTYSAPYNILIAFCTHPLPNSSPTATSTTTAITSIHFTLIFIK